MNDLNKITNTRVGDNIHYYINGKEDRGVVVKMNNAYVTVVKSDGNLHEIHINDTFFVKDILTNKTWNMMNMEERTDELIKAHAFSPRFLSKTWEDLPQELKDVLQKTNIEESTHGQIGGNRAGVSTDTDIKTPEDYKGETDDRDKQTKEEFKHDNDKPTVDKNNGMEEDHKKKDEIDAMQEDWRKTGGESDKQKNFLNKSEPLWKTWLDKDALKPSKQGNKPDPKQTGFGNEGSAVENISAGGSNPDTQSFQGQATHTRRAYNKPQSFRGDKYDSEKPFSKNRLTRYGGKKDVAATYQRSRTGDPRVTSDDDHMRDHTGKRQTTSTQDEGKDREELAYWRKHGKAPPKKQEGHEKDLEISTHGRRFRGRKSQAPIKKSYGKPLYGVTSLEKEGDGAGNSGVTSTETAGVYNARYSDNHGRYRDQEKDHDSRNTSNK
tara:strand:+ start:5937 stop:7247 length:1311 start_codon:yes stop_codon:yes gene_type:complete